LFVISSLPSTLRFINAGGFPADLSIKVQDH